MGIEKLLAGKSRRVFGAYQTQYQRYAPDFAAVNVRATELFDITNLINSARHYDVDVEVHFVRIDSE